MVFGERLDPRDLVVLNVLLIIALVIDLVDYAQVAQALALLVADRWRLQMCLLLLAFDHSKQDDRCEIVKHELEELIVIALLHLAVLKIYADRVRVQLAHALDALDGRTVQLASVVEQIDDRKVFATRSVDRHHHLLADELFHGLAVLTVVVDEMTQLQDAALDDARVMVVVHGRLALAGQLLTSRAADVDAWQRSTGSGFRWHFR